jgi:hypothetical protein
MHIHNQTLALIFVLQAPLYLLLQKIYLMIIAKAKVNTNWKTIFFCFETHIKLFGFVYYS